MTEYSELIKALRCESLSKECDSCGYGYRLCPDSECNDACDVEQIYADAAAAIEALLSKRVEIVRCRECKYWSEVDTSDGLRYGQCDRPDSAIRGTCFIRESWFCADGERREA